MARIQHLVPTGMMTKFILLSSLLAVASSMATGNESNAKLPLDELETIQSVNLYFLKAGIELEPFNGNERLSGRQLKQMKSIKSMLNRVRQEIVSMDGNELLEMASVCESYRTLLGDKTDARPVVAFLDSLARTKCDQVSLDFLMIVANFKPNATPSKEELDHLLVQNYAKLCVQQCWLRFVDSVPRNLERVLGKMAAPLFGFIDKLALNRQWEAKKLAAAHKSDRAIHIDGNPQKERLLNFSDVSSSVDLDEPDQIRAIITTLEDIQLDTIAQQRHFVDGIRKLQADYRDSLVYEDRVESLSLKLHSFYEELFRQPCRQLVERVSSVVAPGQMFKAHNSRTLGRWLADEKERNTRLGYHLQVYRICKLTSQHNAEIERLL